MGQIHKSAERLLRQEIHVNSAKNSVSSSQGRQKRDKRQFGFCLHLMSSIFLCGYDARVVQTSPKTRHSLPLRVFL